MKFNYQLLTPCEQRIVKVLAAHTDEWLSAKQLAELASVSLPTARKKSLWYKLESYGLVRRQYFLAQPNICYSYYGYKLYTDIVLINSQGAVYEIPNLSKQRKS